jgi:hypothetical protein
MERMSDMPPGERADKHREMRDNLPPMKRTRVEAEAVTFFSESNSERETSS